MLSMRPGTSGSSSGSALTCAQQPRRRAWAVLARICVLGGCLAAGSHWAREMRKHRSGALHAKIAPVATMLLLHSTTSVGTGTLSGHQAGGGGLPARLLQPPCAE